jgi:hypothetical protein
MINSIFFMTSPPVQTYIDSLVYIRLQQIPSVIDTYKETIDLCQLAIY